MVPEVDSVHSPLTVDMLHHLHSDWPIDQLMDKLQELVSFTPDFDSLSECLLKALAERLVEAVLPRRAERLMSLVIGCRNVLFQRSLMKAISHKECIVSRAKAQGNKHFLEFHLVRSFTSQSNISLLLTFKIVVEFPQ